MNTAVQIKSAILTTLAAVGSFLANQLGGWDWAMKVLIAFMALDYVTGLIVAGVFKKSNKSDTGALDSKAGFKGLCKKGAILLFVWIAALLDGLTGAAYIRTAVCMFYIANEGLSIMENYALMELPTPEFIKRALEAMKQSGNSGKTEE
jgi:toxin secretion/phage lysis holin